MGVLLTQLEADLLAHTAPRCCTRAEVLAFIHRHHEGAGGDPGMRLAEAILDRWVARGWLGGDEAGLWLRAKAYHEVAWLQLPGAGALQPVSPPEQ